MSLLADNGQGSFFGVTILKIGEWAHFISAALPRNAANDIWETYSHNLSSAGERLRDSQCPSAHPRLPTQLFCFLSFFLFLCLIIFISLWTLTCKKGAISELSVQRLYLHSANVGVSQYAALSRQFSQRPNVINGCHLRGAEWGWGKKKKKVIQRR